MPFDQTANSLRRGKGIHSRFRLYIKDAEVYEGSVVEKVHLQ